MFRTKKQYFDFNKDGDLSIKEGHNIYNVRYLINKFNKDLETLPKNKFENEYDQIDLDYITRRGKWYQYSWKGNHEKSGGIMMNIGIHFFDLLVPDDD